MLSVKATGLLFRQVNHFRGNDLQAGFFNTVVNLTNQVTLHRIRLNDRKCSF
ncbi:Uncharacterised protein [Vibrio cholerae]|nr:Uncharacterised protein [Vibrio cholerae]